MNGSLAAALLAAGEAAGVGCGVAAGGGATAGAAAAGDADAQKAKLSMMGIEAKVSERDQAGRTIFRVRSGPFDDKEQAEKIKARLDASGIDAALVRVQR